jgi:hypothetical protein
MPSKPLVLPDEFILLTMLLRLVSILNNNNGDISMRNYTEIKKTRRTLSTHLKRSHVEADDSMMAVLVWDCEVVSSSYNNGLRYNVTVLANHQEQRNSSDDIQGLTVDGQHSNGYINMVLPPKVASMASPDHLRLQAGSECFGVRIAKNGNSIWPRIRDNDGFHHTWR